MTNQTLTLTLPPSLYQRLKDRAEQARRPVEEEVLAVLAEAVPTADSLPPAVAQVLGDLAHQPDDALWAAARSRLGDDEVLQMEQLHLKQQREGLSPLDMETQATLTWRYEELMLVRAQAAALLKQRGHDVSSLLTSP